MGTHSFTKQVIIYSAHHNTAIKNIYKITVQYRISEFILLDFQATADVDDRFWKVWPFSPRKQRRQFALASVSILILVVPLLFAQNCKAEREAQPPTSIDECMDNRLGQFVSKI